MTTLVNSTEAARLLGVSKPTLYAYVSRGLVARRTAIDGRSSLYDREQLERLAGRGRRRAVTDRPSIDVRISSAITRLDDDGPRYRDLDAVELARSSDLERAAELLWTGVLAPEPVRWQVDREALSACRATVDAAGASDPIVALTLCAAALAERSTPDTAVDDGRRLLAIVPSVLGGPLRGSFAERLTKAWVPRPADELVEAVSRSLVLLADHELATSTLAVRVAASVRTDVMSAVAAGLATVRGSFHGVASRAAAELLDDVAAVGAATAIGRRLDAGERLPGFGHSVYRNGDPRYAPLVEAVRAIPAPPERTARLDSVVAEAGRVIGHPPNVDLALGALLHVADLPRDAPIFAVARIAGWIAHFVEELGERPVRYRGLAGRVAG